MPSETRMQTAYRVSDGIARYGRYSGLTKTSTALPRLAVLFVLSAASSPCPDLNLIHYIAGMAASVFIGTCPILCPYGGFKQGFPLRRFGLPCLNLLRLNAFPFCL
ncbi:hypothetical protein [Neisseria meningitidis]|uniref:hypothetical protein n=1 Tax=Neisseria meningitidis TaxID=487 RepID=UPI0015F04591|nr:hypothetical protein [Neisseria meningitidis]